jgi:hypothetical protein
MANQSGTGHFGEQDPEEQLCAFRYDIVKKHIGGLL